MKKCHSKALGQKLKKTDICKKNERIIEQKKEINMNKDVMRIIINKLEEEDFLSFMEAQPELFYVYPKS